MKYLCLCGVSLLSLLSVSDAMARRSMMPEKPSVEVNLEVLQSLHEQTMAAPFASVSGNPANQAGMPFEARPKSLSPSAAPAVAAGLPERHVPMMNRGMPSAPQQPMLPAYAPNPGLGLIPSAVPPMAAPAMNNTATTAPVGIDSDIPNRPMRGVMLKSSAKHPKPRADKKAKKKEELVDAEQPPVLTVPAMGEAVDDTAQSGAPEAEANSKKSSKKHSKADKIKTGNAGNAGKVVKSGQPEEAPAAPQVNTDEATKDPFADMVMSPPALPKLPDKAALPDNPILPEKQALPDLGKLDAPQVKMPELPSLKVPKTAVPDVPPLPEPNMNKVELKKFPSIEMPPALSKGAPPSLPSLPMPELPKDKPAVPMSGGLPDLGKLKMSAADKELPPVGKPKSGGSVMPVLSKGIDDLISKNDSEIPPILPPAGKLPKLPDVAPMSRDSVALPATDGSKPNTAKNVALPKAPEPLAGIPDMPSLPDMPEPPAELVDDNPAEKMMASLPPLDVPELKGGKTAAAGAALVSIDYPEQETQVPVNMQRQLKELSQKLIANNQAIRIVGVSGGAPDQALAARRAAYSRAMLVRSVLIDNGVNHANITIKTRTAEGKEKAERVEIVAQ